MKIQNNARPSRSGRDKDPIKGKYAGTYKRDGSSLVRTSDGLQLVVINRGYKLGPKSSDKYLINASTPGRDYVSNLYGDQFDDKVFRYQIVQRQEDPDTYDILTLYALSKGRNQGRKRSA